jgi:hypothetical protein
MFARLLLGEDALVSVEALEHPRPVFVAAYALAISPPCVGARPGDGYHAALLTMLLDGLWKLLSRTKHIDAALME